jgi:hypothetical protein
MLPAWGEPSGVNPAGARSVARRFHAAAGYPTIRPRTAAKEHRDGAEVCAPSLNYRDFTTRPGII